MPARRNHPTVAPEPSETRAALIDALCAAAITILSAVPYVSRLGFYSDDWAILAAFSAPGGQQLPTVLAAFPARPVQAIYLDLLFRAFGLAPLAYHLVNTVVLAVGAGLLSLLLVRLGFGRALAFATTVIFMLLPQLSTVRVWYAAFQVPLSLTLMLVSLHCQLSFARFGRTYWLGGAVAAAVLSIGAYEIFAPLIFGFALTLVGLHRPRATRLGRRSVVTIVLVFGIVLAALLYKLFLGGDRTGAIADPNRYLMGLRQLFRVDYDWRVDSGLNILATPRAHFWAPLQGWWSGAVDLARGHLAFEVCAIAAVIAAIVLWRLLFAQAPSRIAQRRLLFVGIAAFLLGNATFLIVPSVVFTSTGIGNRVQVAAAIGVAMLFAGVVALLAICISSRRAGVIFSAIVAGISAIAFVRLTAIEQYWATAPALQQRVLDAAAVDLSSLPPNSTVILDGVCAYHGPAIVFESSWDFNNALGLRIGKPFAGDVVSPRMTLTPTGLRTSIYKEPSFYPFGPQLYIYRPSTHAVVRLQNFAAAAAYFAARSPTTCAGFVARGAEV